MLENLMTTARYRMPDYPYFNDRMTYMDLIQRNYEYEEVLVAPMEGYHYQGNLYGLFKTLGVADNLLPLALYINGFTNPTSYDGSKVSFKIPKMPPIPND